MDSDHRNGQPAANWRRYFSEIPRLNNLLSEAPSDHAKSIKIGKFLSGCLSRPVPIQVNGRTGVATLHAETLAKGHTKVYVFDVVWNAPVVEQSTCAEPPLVANEGDISAARAVSNTEGTEAKAKPAKKPGKTGRSPPLAPPPAKTTEGNSERWD